MKKIDYEAMIKHSIVEGVMQSHEISSDSLNTLYGVLMNTDSLSKLKPFNFKRHENQISEDYTIYKIWLNTIAGTTCDAMNTGRRIARAIERLSKEYEDILPTTLSGTNGLAFAVRLFYLTPEETMSLTNGSLMTFMAIAYVLQTMFLLDMIFISDTVAGLDSEKLLRTILTNSGTALQPVMTAVVNAYREKGDTNG